MTSFVPCVLVCPPCVLVCRVCPRLSRVSSFARFLLLSPRARAGSPRCAGPSGLSVDAWIDQHDVAIPLEHTVPRSAKCWRKDGDKYKKWATRPNPKDKAPHVPGACGHGLGGGPRVRSGVLGYPHGEQHYFCASDRKIVWPTVLFSKYFSVTKTFAITIFVQKKQFFSVRF